MCNLETIGERLKHVRRQLIKESRAKICAKYGLSSDTLCSWENNRVNISNKGVEQCIDIFGQENIIVSKEWLITGKGRKPRIYFDIPYNADPLNVEYKDNKNNEDSLLLLKEVEYFHSLSKSSVTAQISRTDMLPLYNRGDYVGGRYIHRKNIECCVGKDCIIITADGHTYIRRVAKSKSRNSYNLVCLNPTWNGNPEPVLFDIEIEYAAPIIWHRRLGIFS